MGEIKICYIKFVGTDIDGLNAYELLFSDNVDEVWGDDFDVMPMGLCNDLQPYDDCWSVLKTIKTNITLKLIQDSLCNSYQDCVDHCVSLAYESLEGYDEYPSDGRLVIQHGDTLEEVERKLADKNIVFEE